MAQNRGREVGPAFLEFALILILVAVVVLAILLIFGDDIRVFINDLILTWFPA